MSNIWWLYKNSSSPYTLEPHNKLLKPSLRWWTPSRWSTLSPDSITPPIRWLVCLSKSQIKWSRTARKRSSRPAPKSKTYGKETPPRSSKFSAAASSSTANTNKPIRPLNKKSPICLKEKPSILVKPKFSTNLTSSWKDFKSSLKYSQTSNNLTH